MKFITIFYSAKNESLLIYLGKTRSSSPVHLSLPSLVVPAPPRLILGLDVSHYIHKEVQDSFLVLDEIVVISIWD